MTLNKYRQNDFFADCETNSGGNPLNNGVPGCQLMTWIVNSALYRPDYNNRLFLIVA